MKNLVLASALGTLVGTFAVPVITGPIHFQVTKPFSMFGWLPAVPTIGGTVSVALGTVPTDFVLTDVLREDYYNSRLLVKVNGNPVFCAGTSSGTSYTQGNIHMTTGILIPSGSQVVVEVTSSLQSPTPVTLAGYLQ
ncbi:MAG TPA: hypothetical protein VFD82_03925 [Planctomycetota bacterium]|nr:hypothetical protein [Planctomycetota bacterium]